MSTCATLWPIFMYWRSSPTVLWQAHGWCEAGVIACFYLSWVALFFSLRASGFGYQTGWTQWLYWIQGQPLPRRPLTVHGLYRWLRHSAYLSFMGLIWFTPRMTADHAVLTVVWTVYIYIGSCLKDQRLLYYLGDTYRQYASRVPGYPGILFGPLAKWPSPTMTTVEADGERCLARKAA
jgi:protein-S-isoprenylcysteine O-methyltransferase Ste14